MAMITITKSFPNSRIGEVHQTGRQLSEEQGLTVHLHTREGEETPCSAELVGEHHYADIGLEWNERTLTGYDGVFELPKEIEQMLIELGFAIDL